MSLYFRIKRKEQTVFLSAEPSDTVQKLKNDLVNINSVSGGSDNIRLIYQNNPLDDRKTISQLNIPNDSVIFMVYKQGDGSYEEIAPSVLASLQQ
eukprot:gene2124-2615_t